MNKVSSWYRSLSRRKRDSILISISIIGLFSTIFTILGVSLKDFIEVSICYRILIVMCLFLVVYIAVCSVIGQIYKNSVKMSIRQTSISITYGDIFETPEQRLIGCDTRYDTRVDDVVISKNSLHGKLFLKYGNIDDIRMTVEAEAKRLGLQKDSGGLYEFPLGTIIRYNSSIDGHTYLMLALSKLNTDHEAHINMTEFVSMLMRMWRELSRVYAGKEIALPLLGTGVLRFDDGVYEKGDLLRCMLFTLDNCGVRFCSRVKILIPKGTEDVSLYEYKDIF